MKQDGDRSTRWLPWTLAVLAAGYVAALWSNPLGQALWGGDTDAYVGFHPLRSAAYPLFLELTRTLFGAFGAAAALQLLLAAAAYSFLAWSIHRAFAAPRLALLVALALFGNWEMATYHPRLYTESCFLSVLCMMLGAMARVVQRPAAGWAAVSALACGVAVALRPAAASLLLAWPILLWFVWPRCTARRRLALAAAIAVPLMACSVAEGMAWRARHGAGERPTLVDLHLFSKALIMDGVELEPEDELARFVIQLREKLAPAREFVAGAPDWQVRTLLRSYYEMRLHRIPSHEAVVAAEVEAEAARRGVSEFELQGEVGRRVVTAAPAAWLANAFDYYLAQWWIPRVLAPEPARRYAEYVGRVGGVPLIEIDDIGPYPYLAPLTRLVMGGALLASLAAIVLAVGQRRRGLEPDARLALAAVCGLLTHGHYALVAAAGVALSRYSLAMWPCLALCSLLVAGHAVERLRAADR